MREGLLLYGCEYEARYGADSKLGQDSVLGEAWLDMAHGYLALLNGETGRLDCGTLDGELRRWAARFGFEGEVRDVGLDQRFGPGFESGIGHRIGTPAVGSISHAHFTIALAL
jgi:hypothetical protein